MKRTIASLFVGLIAGFGLTTATHSGAAARTADQAADAAQDQAPATRPSIFISPYGEPFVSAPGEPYPVAAWFAGADTDHDGRLTPEEFAADGQRWFTRLDQNGDGIIDPAEIAAYERMIDAAFLRVGALSASGPGGRGGWGGGRRGGGGGRMGLGEGGGQEDEPSHIQPHEPRVTAAAESSERMARAGLLAVPQPVRSADRNMDQKITVQEWTATGQRWFSLLDTKHQGYLTLDGLPQTALQSEGARRGRGRR